MLPGDRNVQHFHSKAIARLRERGAIAGVGERDPNLL